MSALMAERRDLADEGRQESLFEANSPPRAPARNPWAPPLEPPREAAVPPLEDVVEGPLDEVVAPVEDVAAPATEDVGERRAPRRAGTPLAGPTLDDVMSRVWEGLVTGLPAACPVCHGEVEPALGGPASGRCRSCGMAID